MSRYQWLVSVFLVWHIFSFAVGSLGSPDSFHPRQSTHETVENGISDGVKPLLDSLLAVFEPAATTLHDWAGPLRMIVRPYIQSTGIPQGWQMFRRPPEYRSYVRLTYFWRQPPQSSPMTHSQIVFPADREDRVRGLDAYWNKYRNKTISNAYRGFFRRLDAHTDQAAERPTHLTSILRYFADCFRRERLSSANELVRVELWHGRAAIPSPGRRSTASQQTLHRVTLADYYADLEPVVFNEATHADYDSIEVEADIQWRLLDIHEP